MGKYVLKHWPPCRHVPEVFPLHRPPFLTYPASNCALNQRRHYMPTGISSLSGRICLDRKVDGSKNECGHYHAVRKLLYTCAEAFDPFEFPAST